MKLLGKIDPQLPLLVFALEEEAAHVPPGLAPVLITGMGKICATFALTRTLSSALPARVINLGTAGALKPGLAGTHVVRCVVQHDFDSETLLGLTGQTVGLPIELDTEGLVLASGDVFVSGGAEREKLEQIADLVDMEGYAVAETCRRFQVPVTLCKVVSDSACDSAAESWQQTVDACAGHLARWLQSEIS